MSKNNLPAPVIFGYTAEATAGIEDVLLYPEPPSNYGAEAAERWRQDPSKGLSKWNDLVAGSAYRKVTGRLTNIFAVAPLEQEVFDPRGRERPKSLACEFVDWLFSLYPNAFRLYPGRRDSEQNGVAFYGFDPKPFVRVLGIECLLHDKDVPIGLWYQNEDCFDPYDMVVESEARKAFPVQKLLSSVGVVYHEQWRPHVDPAEDARIAAELVSCFNLMPRVFGEELVGIVQDNLKSPAFVESEEEEDEDGYEEEEYEEYEEGEYEEEEYEEEEVEDEAEEDESEEDLEPEPVANPKRRTKK